MPRGKQYLDIDVLTAARERIRHIYDIFDSVIVMFSGGKDSSCVLQLAKEVVEERGLGKVEAVFWDEELLPMSNIDLLSRYREYDWLNLNWYCIPCRYDKFVLGTLQEYVVWDPNRPWTRERPEWAITPEDLGLDPVKVWGPGEEYQKDDLIEKLYPGSVALVNGVRASESLSRFRSVVNKLNENYICQIEGRGRSNLRLCKPIYDWTEMDVLKFLNDNGIEWCSIYDAQELSGSTLRIGPPLGVASAKRVGQIREYEPEWYERLIVAFPEMAAQERYWTDFDVEALINKYLPEGWNGVLHYIEDWIQPGPYRARCIQRYKYYKTMAEKRPDEFPIEHLLRQTIRGGRERKFRGIDTTTKAAKKGKQKP